MCTLAKELHTHTVFLLIIDLELFLCETSVKFLEKHQGDGNRFLIPLEDGLPSLLLESPWLFMPSWSSEEGFCGVRSVP